MASEIFVIRWFGHPGNPRHRMHICLTGWCENLNLLRRDHPAMIRIDKDMLKEKYVCLHILVRIMFFTVVINPIASYKLHSVLH